MARIIADRPAGFAFIGAHAIVDQPRLAQARRDEQKMHELVVARLCYVPARDRL